MSVKVRGSLHVVVGPMFSGKSGELLRLAMRHEIAHSSVALVNHASDTRYDPQGGIATHDTRKRACDASVHALLDANKTKAVQDADVVLVDEGHFFEDLVSACMEWTEDGKTVIVAALSGTWEQEPFPEVARLMSRADTSQLLTAVCVKCGKDAPFSSRKTKENALEVVGGTDKYEALCGICLQK